MKGFFMFVCFLLWSAYDFKNVVDGQYVYYREYYWRDYDGLIQPDAVEAGIIDGQITYIGQLLVPDISSILPATIFRNKTVVSVYGKVQIENNDVKILCSKNADLIRWVKVTSDDFPKPSDLIYGGFQNGTRLYIGRAVYGNDTIVGRAIGYNSSYKKGLYISTNDGELLLKTYDILAHRPPQKDYYWRDYVGYIPDDAVEGGMIYGERAFIGQATYVRTEVNTSFKQRCVDDYGNHMGNTDVNNSHTYVELIPVYVFSGNLTALAFTDKLFTLNKNLKILCSGHKENIIWVQNTELNSHKTEDFIIGGNDALDPYFVLKVNKPDGEVIKYISKSVLENYRRSLPDEDFVILTYNI